MRTAAAGNSCPDFAMARQREAPRSVRWGRDRERTRNRHDIGFDGGIDRCADTEKARTDGQAPRCQGAEDESSSAMGGARAVCGEQRRESREGGGRVEGRRRRQRKHSSTLAHPLPLPHHHTPSQAGQSSPQQRVGRAHSTFPCSRCGARQDPRMQSTVGAHCTLQSRLTRHLLHWSLVACWR